MECVSIFAQGKNVYHEIAYDIHFEESSTRYGLRCSLQARIIYHSRCTSFPRSRYICTNILSLVCQNINLTDYISGNTLHFYFMQCCILIAAELRFCPAFVSISTRLCLDRILLSSRYSPGLISVSFWFHLNFTQQILSRQYLDFISLLAASQQ